MARRQRVVAPTAGSGCSTAAAGGGGGGGGEGELCLEARLTRPARPTLGTGVCERGPSPTARRTERRTREDPHSPGCALVLEKGRGDLVVVVGGSAVLPRLVGVVERALGRAAPCPDRELGGLERGERVAGLGAQVGEGGRRWWRTVRRGGHARTRARCAGLW